MVLEESFSAHVCLDLNHQTHLVIMLRVFHGNTKGHCGYMLEMLRGVCSVVMSGQKVPDAS